MKDKMNLMKHILKDEVFLTLHPDVQQFYFYLLLEAGCDGIANASYVLTYHPEFPPTFLQELEKKQFVQIITDDLLTFLNGFESDIELF